VDIKGEIEAAGKKGLGLCLCLYGNDSHQIEIEPGFNHDGASILGKLKSEFGCVKIYLEEITGINASRP
jgi:hypothetical protein